MTTSAPHQRTPDELRSLVLEAFRRARRTGKPEWYRMAPAVLKNRLLDVTGRRFDEREYGAQRFSELVPLLSGTISVDASVRPPVVELLPEARALVDGEEQAPQATARARVRPDLWNAVLDYSSASKWRWNRETSIAEPVESDDVPDDELLPTISASDLVEWRNGFIDEHEGDLPESVKSAAIDWAEHGRRSESLPRNLRGLWFEYLKNRVIDTAEAWFTQHGLPIPADLREETAARPRRATGEVDELREFIIRCVRTMSAAELASLQLPAAAAHRTPR